MKHFNKPFQKKLKLCCLALLIPSTVSAVSSQELAEKCPVQFVGTVVEIADTVAPFASPHQAMSTIKFKVHISQRGSSKTYEEVKILRHGPHSLFKGQLYQVELNGKYLCSLNEYRKKKAL
ncbi:MAG: hypothetical protein HN509_13490 [Halobacteriovoraceae bacterium]|jgi:hypothetical protein|nr:hypothetical protein [Halobacteriovoraceae bacterium]